MSKIHLPVEAFEALPWEQKADVLTELVNTSTIDVTAGDTYSRYLRVLTQDEFEAELNRVIDDANRYFAGMQQ